MTNRDHVVGQDTRAEQWAGIPADSWLRDERVLRSKSKHLELLGLLGSGQPARIVLDAGCGPGTYGLIIAEQTEARVVGIDVSKAAVKKAAQRRESPGEARANSYVLKAMVA